MCGDFFVFNVCGRSRIAMLHILKKKRLFGQVLGRVVGTRLSGLHLRFCDGVKSYPCGALSRADADAWFALMPAVFGV